MEMMALPESWAVSSVGDVSEYIQRGKSPKYADLSRLPVVNQRSIRWHGIQDEHLKYVHEDQFSAWDEARFIREGDILWNSTGTGTIGRACLVRQEHTDPPKVVDSHVTIVRPNKLIVEPGYLFAWIRGPEVQQKIEDLATGTTNQIELNRSTIASTLIPIAPVNEQRRIAAKLDATLAAVDACRQRLDGVAAILKRFRQAVLAAATSGELTRAWREKMGQDFEWLDVQLGEHAESMNYGTSAKSQSEGEVPVLRMGNLQGGELDWTDLVYTSDLAEIAKYMLDDGDVLFNRTNSPELVGKTAIYRGERPAIYAGYLIRVRCRPSLDPEFLNLCLNSPAARDYCWRVKSDGVSQSNINAKKLAAYPFLLPSIEEQEEIVHRAQELFSLSHELEAKLTAALRIVERLTPALLAKAFRGELVPQDPDDEPASPLLAKLKLAQSNAANISPRRRAKQPKRLQTMSISDKDSIKAAILNLKTDRFSFDELRDQAGGDYESLKRGLFELLEEQSPIVRQVFDQEAKAMKLERIRP
ncbi:MAG: restriction endonuclease subunit S [Verrucomicrobiaceae bacterium]